jgi:hypothetical protein
MKQIFDLQFWVIIVLFCPIFFFGGRWLKTILIDTVSNSVGQVVKDQWALMFLKLDEYKSTVESHGTSIQELKDECAELQKKAKVNRADIEIILEKVRNLK